MHPNWQSLFAWSLPIHREKLPQITHFGARTFLDFLLKRTILNLPSHKLKAIPPNGYVEKEFKVMVTFGRNRISGREHYDKLRWAITELFGDGKS